VPDDPCAPLVLDDGRWLQVHPLRRQNAAAEQAFVQALSRQSRYRRFHVGLPSLPPALLTQLVDVDQHKHVALAAWPLGQARIAADARYVRTETSLRALGDEGVGAEFALTVADDWQRAGLGRQLLLRLARHAVAHGVTHLSGDVLRDNRPMIALVERLGGRLQAQPGDPVVLRAQFRAAALSA
jgi:acetyltransferase